MKNTEDFVQEMEQSNILMSREFTFSEYVTEVSKFQDMVCKMISGNAYHESMRIDEAMFILESTAREKGVRSHPAVCNAVLTMKKLAKEIAITMSGAKGESMVSRTLEFLKRPNTQIYRNVYISDGIDETELDGIVLTDNGVIVLEVKKVKSDLALTEDGRMVFAGDECYDKMPLADKMEAKRNLLRKCLEKAIAASGLNIPVFVDSLIVFSAPKGQYVRVDDRCHREKYCFRSNLNKKIENYSGCGHYGTEQLVKLGSIFSEMESNVKRFETEMNFDVVRRSLADAMVVLKDSPVNQKTTATEKNESIEKTHIAEINTLDTQHFEPMRQQASRKTANFGYAAASVITVLLATSSLLISRIGVNRA